MLSLTFRDRRCIFVARLFLCRAHAGAVDKKSQWLDKKFKMLVQCENVPRFYWFPKRDVSYGSTRSSSRSPSRFFHAHAHLPCSSLVKYRLVMLWYRKLIKSFSVSSICERTVFCLLLEIHIFAANSRGTTRKIRRTTCQYSHDHCKYVSNWYRPVWTGSEDSRCRVSNV